MTATDDATAPAEPAQAAAAAPSARDHRGSPLPTLGMITSRLKELRKRRGLMIALIVVTIGVPTVFLAIRLLLHAVAPNTYGAAGGYSTYTGMTSGVLYILGFIVAATLGSTAGSVDLTEGMFRHLVVTGRSRLAIYLARVPAGLAIVASLVAVGFTIVCVVCVFAAPTTLNYDGVNVPAGLSQTGFESWASNNASEVICNFNLRLGPPTPANAEIRSVLNTEPCPFGGPVGPSGTTGTPPPPAEASAVARQIAAMDYADYATQFRVPTNSLMIETGLWIELEAAIGFVVGLGLASLIGQRTVGVILMILLEVIITPILSRARIPHMINLQRAVVGVATAHLVPGGLPVFGGGGGGPGSGSGNPRLIPEPTTAAVIVIVAWLVGWTVLGAWRMMTRDA